VLTALLILMLGLAPSLFSLWVMRRADIQAQARLQFVLESFSSRGLPNLRLSSDQTYVEGLGYITGDLTCRFNARSSYVRCAVNPSGPCQICSHYESIEIRTTE
jgi:Family of unknown function (DUF6464)